MIGTVFSGHSAALQHGLEAARFLDEALPHCRVRLLSPAESGLSRIQQCFLLARLPGGG
jgi:hypothetical protein